MKTFKKIGLVIPAQIGMDSAYRIYDASRNNLMTEGEEEREELARELQIRWNMYPAMLKELRILYRREGWVSTGDILRKIRKLRRRRKP